MSGEWRPNDGEGEWTALEEGRPTLLSAVTRTDVALGS